MGLVVNPQVSFYKVSPTIYRKWLSSDEKFKMNKRWALVRSGGMIVLLSEAKGE